MSFTLTEQIAELKREVAIRENVYPRWVQSGKLKQADADKQIGRMKAALHTLIALEVKP